MGIPANGGWNDADVGRKLGNTGFSQNNSGPGGGTGPGQGQQGPTLNGIPNGHGWAVGDTNPGISPQHLYGDTNMPMFGGSPGAASQIAGQYLMQGDDFAHRQISDANANPWRMAQGADRGEQAQALDMQRSAALGQAPSAAAINQGSALNAGLASQLGAAHAGGLMSGLGSHVAMANAGSLANAAINQGGNARANELGAANRGYMGMAGALRHSDIGALGIDQAREAQEAQMNQQSQLASQGLANQALTNQLNAASGTYNTQYGMIAGQGQAIQKADREYGRDLMGAGMAAGAGALAAYGKLSNKYGSPGDTSGYGSNE